MQSISPETSLPLPRNPKKETISIGFDVNDHVYSKLKSVYNYVVSQTPSQYPYKPV